MKYDHTQDESLVYAATCCWAGVDGKPLSSGPLALLSVTTGLGCCYRQEPRFYHNSWHIRGLLLDAPPSVPLHLAILYHDAVYGPSLEKPEQQCINMLLRDSKLLFGAETPFDVLQAKSILEQAIKLEGPLPPLDWKVVGASREHYQDYSRKICREYRAFGVSKQKFSIGRVKFLLSALKTVASNDFGLGQSWQNQAFVNMSLELTCYKVPPYSV
jgi:predicted metal-dependent HD superfamily phosphohydrolase